MLRRIFGFIGAIPHGLIIKAAVYLLVFALGAAVGNRHATEAALQRELQASADRQRENHRILLADKEATREKLRAEYDLQRAADKEAFTVYQRGIVEASRGKRAAETALAAERARLAKSTETNDGLRKVNEILAAEMAVPNPGCILSGGVRVALNDYIASLNNRPSVGYSQAPSASLPYGPSSPTELLACSDLAASVTDILEHDAMMTAWVLSFQAWADEALR